MIRSVSSAVCARRVTSSLWNLCSSSKMICCRSDSFSSVGHSEDTTAQPGHRKRAGVDSQGRAPTVQRLSRRSPGLASGTRGSGVLHTGCCASSSINRNRAKGAAAWTAASHEARGGPCGPARKCWEGQGWRTCGQHVVHLEGARRSERRPHCNGERSTR